MAMDPVIRLGNKTISRNGNNVYIVAEIGQNHQGNIDIAKQMIVAAKQAGCDCVKFQKSNLAAKFTKSALERPYSSVNSWGVTYGEHKRFLEFSIEQFKELQSFSNELAIDFSASAMDEMSLEDLAAIGVPFIKIGSGDTNNIPFIHKAAKLRNSVEQPLPLVVSTGMQSMTTVERAVDILELNGANFALLHCVSAYPTQAVDANLQMITFLRQRFTRCVIGYSGHEQVTVKLSLAAVLLGARIVERHFTLNKLWKGTDHQCSLEPVEMAELVSGIRALTTKGLLNTVTPYSKEQIISLVGHDEALSLALQDIHRKTIQPCELNCKHKLGKSLVAARNLQKGQILRAVDMRVKVSEPNGVLAESYEQLLGITLLRDVAADEALQYSDLSKNLNFSYFEASE